MKKLLLTLGAIASVAAPVAAVVACGTTPAKVSPALTKEAQKSRAEAIADQWDKDMKTEDAKAKAFEAQVAKDAKTAADAKAAAIPNTIGALVEFDGVTYKDLDTFLKAWIAQVQKFIDGSKICQDNHIKKISYSVNKDGIVVNLLDSDDSVTGSTKNGNPHSHGKIIANKGINIFQFNAYTLDLLGVPGFATEQISGLDRVYFPDDHKLVIEHLDKDETK